MGDPLTFWHGIALGIFVAVVVTWAVCDVRAGARENTWAIRMAGDTTDAFVNGFHKGREAKRVASLPAGDRCWEHPGYSIPCPRCEAGG